MSFGIRVSVTAVSLCLVLAGTSFGQIAPLVSVFEKPDPETRRDLFAIQHAAMTISRRAIPCTVGLVWDNAMGSAMGSGVVISEDGYILTAKHVIDHPGQEVLVKFPDGTEAEAIALGVHTKADGALVKITEKGKWPHMPLAGPEHGAKPGDWCLALGHPGGFDEDRGPPVRLGRVLEVTSTVIRSDCPITGGDSGGPLFDMQGRVIGIHSRIARDETENYHVPSGAYHEAWDALMNSEIYPKPVPSLFLAMLDEDDDGQITRSEQSSDYMRRVFDRLVTEFELDPQKPLPIEELTKDHFGWERETTAGLVEIEDITEFEFASLHSSSYVRGSRIQELFIAAAEESDGPSDVAVKVYADGRRVALGTIVDADGYILTKASRLEHHRIECRLPDGRDLPAAIVAHDSEYDLALLRVDARNLNAPVWSERDLNVGMWVTTPQTNGRLQSNGVISVLPRRIKPIQPMLGVEIDRQIINEVVVTNVVRNSGAARAGIQTGDTILRVAEKQVSSVDEILKTLRKYRAGDTVPVDLERNDQEQRVEVTLLARPDIFFNQSGMGSWRMSGSLSRRRDGFGAAFQIDAIVPPPFCGGPILDVNGNLVGVTLARANRVASYGIGREALLPVLEKLRTQADIALTKAEGQENETDEVK